MTCSSITPFHPLTVDTSIPLAKMSNEDNVTWQFAFLTLDFFFSLATNSHESKTLVL